MLKSMPFAFILLIAGTLVYTSACSPKTKDVVIQQEEPAPTVDIKCPGFQHLTAYEREQAENSFVLYKDFYSLGKYKEAFPYWRKAYGLAPGSNGQVKSHFADGVALYADLIGKTDSPVQKQLYMDTISQIYSKREECFDADADYYAQKAFDYYYKLGDLVDEDKVYNTFTQAIKSGGGNIPYYIINPFTKLLYDRVIDEKVTTEEASTYAKNLTTTIQNGVANCNGKECDSWAIINEYAPDLLSSFEGIDGFYDCEYYTQKYYTLYKENPDDCETINTAYSRLLRGQCSQDNSALIEVAAAKQEKCYTPPPPPGLLRQGYDAYQAGDYKNSVKLFEQYVTETDDTEKKAKYLLLIAKIYYGDIKNFPKSREYALKAAKLKDGWGEPYILIGKLYASSGPICGPGRGWDSQIVTWPAIDKFTYARNIDPNVADEANKWISTYRKYMPSREDIFQRNIKEGSSFYVGCWIKESTTVRTP